MARCMLYIKATKQNKQEAQTMTKHQTDIIEVTIEAPSGINSQTGKSEEIEILNRITNRFKGTQTYLSMLFTENVVEWFNNKVHDDFSTDLFMEYQAEIETNRNLSVEISKSQSSLEFQTKRMEELAVAYQNELETRDRTIGENKAYMAEVREALSQSRRDWMQVDSEKNKLTAEVTKLKVMLFDLQNKTVA